MAWSRLHVIWDAANEMISSPANDLFFIDNVSHLLIAFLKVLNIMATEIAYIRRFLYERNVSLKSLTWSINT